MNQLFIKHQELINAAIAAQRDRAFFAGFPEHPKAYAPDGDAVGQEAFKSHLNSRFIELQSSEDEWIGKEVSPYTVDELGVKYPSYSVDKLISNAKNSLNVWRKLSVEDRAGILTESLYRFSNRFFEVAYATMHTTGQGYMMAFQASGPHAADRALEAIANGVENLSQYKNEVLWEKPMGKYSITLQKHWRAVPKGISVVIGCSTFPVWNSLPGIYASLITGNSVIIKPHPGAILPIAIVAAELRNVLRECNIDPDCVQLAADTPENPITKKLAEHAEIDIIDYTGNAQFGNYLEKIEGKTVFTEKTGVNSVILHSAENIQEVAANLAFSVCLYSGQMCTAPQNFFIPKAGIMTPEGAMSAESFGELLANEIKGLTENPKAGPYVLGAIQNPLTCTRTQEAEKTGKLILASGTVENPQFPKARTLTPAIIAVNGDKEAEFSKELFGPIILLIEVSSIEDAVSKAAKLAKKHGAISCGAYTTDDDVMEMITDQMSLSATPVSFNLTGGIYVNQHAGFSDFHVTGGNPAGNASFTDQNFINRRFTWVGFRKPV